jgi:hypothetical protein
VVYAAWVAHSDGVDTQAFDLPPASSLIPGASPYRVAGVLYRGVVDYIEAVIPGGVPTVVKELPHRRLGDFLAQPFGATGKYDVLPLPYVAETLARLRGVSLAEQLRHSNAFSEERIGKLYRALLQLLSADTVALALPRAVSIAYDFSRTTVEVRGPREVAGVRRGIPRPVVRWLAISSAAYTERALSRTGAAFVSVSTGVPVFEKTVGDTDLFGVPFAITWG